jgi:hypothetical protein
MSLLRAFLFIPAFPVGLCSCSPGTGSPFAQL